jgi:hypothetical protein
MAKKIDPNEPLTKLELDIVFLRYFQGLCNPEVAEKLGLQLNQVKYRINRPNVKQYIREEVLPYKRRQRIAVVVLVFSFLAIVSTALFL